MRLALHQTFFHSLSRLMRSPIAPRRDPIGRGYDSPALNLAALLLVTFIAPKQAELNGYQRDGEKKQHQRP
jgi:hypothetical protein